MRQRILDTALKRQQYRQDALIEILHTVQTTYGFLAPELLWYVASQLKLPPSLVYGVATFYNFFSLKPQGAHCLVVCTGTACHIQGSAAIRDAVEKRFGIASGETTEDGQLSLLTAHCLGSCSLAPAATLDGRTIGKTSAASLIAEVEKLVPP